MIRLRTLGTLDLRSATGVALERVLAQPKRLAFLVYLALAEEGTWLRRDTVLALFWPELDEEHARSALRNTLHFLRRELGDDVVLTRGDEIATNAEGFWCDARSFLSLVQRKEAEKGLALYEGEFLPGVHLADGVEFERWVDSSRERLRRLARDAALGVATADAAKGDPTNAEKWLRFSLALFPDDEVALRNLIRLLDAKGDRTGALREYRSFSQRLLADYETEPSPESNAVVQAILNRSGSVGSTSEWPSARSASESAPAETEWPPHQQTNPSGNPSAPRQHAAPLLVAMTVFALVSIAGAGVLWKQRTTERAATRAVIEPFSNRTGRAELGSVGQMAGEWMEKALAENGLLEVLPFRNGPGTTGNASGTSARQRAGRVGLGEFRARWLVTGSYYLERDTLQFRADVIDLSTGRVRATIGPTRGPREKPSQAIEALVDKTIGAITQITTGDGTEDRSRPNGVVAHPRSPEAVRAFRAGINDFVHEAKYDEALGQFHRAYALDTTDAVPLLEAGFIHWTRGEYAEVASLVERVRPGADRLPQQARLWLDLWDSKLRGESQRALEINRRLVRLVPKGGWELQGGYHALRANQPAEAVKIIETADTERGLLAGLFSPFEIQAEAYHMMGQHLAELDVAIRERTRFPSLRSARLHEIQALAALGRTDAMEERLQDSRGLPAQTGMAPSLPPRSALVSGAIALAASAELRAHGNPAAARSVALESADLYREEKRVTPSSIARQEIDHGLAAALYQAGRLDEARSVLEHLAREGGDNIDTRGMLGTIAARQSRAPDAAQALAQLSRTKTKYLFGRDLLWRARIKAVLGEREEAVRLLRAAFEQGHGFGIELHRDIDLESLRGLESYRNLVQLRG